MSFLSGAVVLERAGKQTLETFAIAASQSDLLSRHQDISRDLAGTDPGAASPALNPQEPRLFRILLSRAKPRVNVAETTTLARREKYLFLFFPVKY